MVIGYRLPNTFEELHIVMSVVAIRKVLLIILITLQIKTSYYIIRRMEANSSWVFIKWWTYARVCLMQLKHWQFVLIGVKSILYLVKPV